MFTGGMLITSGAYCYRKMNDKEKGRIKKEEKEKSWEEEEREYWTQLVSKRDFA